MSPAVEIDTVRLAEAIHTRLFRTGKSANEVARLLGFSPQVFSDLNAAVTGRTSRTRARGAYQPGSSILLTICWWLDADPRDFQKVQPDALPVGEADAALLGPPIGALPMSRPEMDS